MFSLWCHQPQSQAGPELQSMLGPYKGLEHSLHLPLREAEQVSIGLIEHSLVGPASIERDKTFLHPGKRGDESKSS